MIKSLYVEGLNGRNNPLDLEFNHDLNLLTGKNGSSKTTLLKLIWYLNSARVNSLIKEVNFNRAVIITDTYKLDLTKDQDNRFVNISINDEKSFTLSDQNLRELDYRRPVRINEKLNVIVKNSVPTIFFPTFRRIEGGFSMDNNQFDPAFGRNDEIRDALEQLSRKLSFRNQRFITSISTDDIVTLLNSEYSNINSKINLTQKQKSDEIIKKIKDKFQDEKQTLENIKQDIEEMESEREKMLKPFTTLSELIQTIFHHKGINLSNLTIGEVNNAISSDKLSAGEKQMLSFICYNAFTKDHTIFIDEPELSLHPDWQRTLVPTLLNQGNNNQFFMATHSPFIFSKYSDKEIMLSDDKGE
ncbi:AAA family ATPase [Flavobacterium branchiophilum]|nr:ATP-binding protein [Flavobacterium branchiophilum]